ncbi:MAG: hypothetical protein DRP09_18755, partial [Candidatus Thorarchaeota archaeon]
YKQILILKLSMEFRLLYNKHYKKLFAIPLLIVLVSLAILYANYAETGDIIKKDVTLKGGLIVTVYTDASLEIVESAIKEAYPDADISARRLIEFGTEKQIGLIIEASDITEEELKPVLEKALGVELTRDNYSVEEAKSTLGEAFYKQMLIAILLALLFMAVVVFITFRTFIPSLAVVFAAFADMTVTLAVLNLLDIKLSTAGIAAILLLLGYSIDTDILMTTRVLKRREGTIYERIKSSVKTGLTMTSTTLVALIAGYIVSQSIVIKQMFTIIIIGLIVDVIMTYLMNAGLLVWYAKKKNV